MENGILVPFIPEWTVFIHLKAKVSNNYRYVVCHYVDKHYIWLSVGLIVTSTGRACDSSAWSQIASYRVSRLRVRAGSIIWLESSSSTKTDQYYCLFTLHITWYILHEYNIQFKRLMPVVLKKSLNIVWHIHINSNSCTCQ